MELKNKLIPIDLKKIHALIKKIDESKVPKISPYYVYLNGKIVKDGFISNKPYCIKSAEHNNLNDAFNIFLRWFNQVSLMHGYMVEVKLTNKNLQTIIKEYIESEKLPLGSIILTYDNYSVIEVREARPGERYCHLNYGNPKDEVYINFNSFLNCYKNNIGIFQCIIYGISIIDEFIYNYINKKKMNIKY